MISNDLMPTPAPSYVELKTVERLYAKCYKCNFYGDTIYFNTHEDVDRSDKDYWNSSTNLCGFCELPSIFKTYGESLRERCNEELAPLEKPRKRTIIELEDLQESGNLPELTKLVEHDNIIITITGFDHGRFDLSSCLVEIYSFELVDD